jgi:hypothetical protein
MMELLGDVGHVESRFSPFGGSVTLELYVPLAYKSVWTHPMELVGDLG